MALPCYPLARQLVDSTGEQMYGGSMGFYMADAVASGRPGAMHTSRTHGTGATRDACTAQVEMSVQGPVYLRRPLSPRAGDWCCQESHSAS